jgi:signal peptidase I
MADELIPPQTRVSESEESVPRRSPNDPDTAIICPQAQSDSEGSRWGPNGRIASPGSDVAATAPPSATPAAASGQGKDAGKEAPHEPKDNFREVVETIVFVVVLVLMLKSFAAEAFVIPTGSMAETLWGYQKVVTCPKCEHTFPVNCSSEVEPQEDAFGGSGEVIGCTCPNCRWPIAFDQLPSYPHWQTGDRVLVAKFLYDLVEDPQRFDVVVFKYPRNPQKNYQPMNYIKRLIGRPGETIAIWQGDLYVADSLNYSAEPVDSKAVREKTFTDDPSAMELFRAEIVEQTADDTGKFRIIRKTPDKMLSLRRLVNDNDKQDKRLPPHWLPANPAETAWKSDSPATPREFRRAGDSKGDEIDWLRYQHVHWEDAINVHLPPTRPTKPCLITDFMGYNTAARAQRDDNIFRLPANNWVADLMLECEVETTEGTGLLLLDLAKGVDRFRATFDLETGECKLSRHGFGKTIALGQGAMPTELRPGKHRLRFANFDRRLVVWVDDVLVFGDGVDYEASRRNGPTKDDLEPARIGVKGGTASVTVRRLKLWRDTYYTTSTHGQPSSSDASGDQWRAGSPAWSDPDQWGPLRNLPFRTMYVQPNHYLCLGDNSPESSDGRNWGLVPSQLLLGKALLVYYPLSRAGPIK